MPESHVIEYYHLLSYDEIDSTNDEARRLAVAGGQHGAVIWAKKQSSGKGRMNRTWVSKKGNLYCSLLLKPDASHTNFAQLSFVASLAVYQALESVILKSHHLSLKWPNDILLDDKKLGGILLESVKDTDGRYWIICGLGVNIEHFPKDTIFPATSLKDSGIEIISAKIVLSRFLNCFLPLYDMWINDGFSTIRKEWMRHAAYQGKEVNLLPHDNADAISGRFEGIDSQGQCLLRDREGARHTYHAGDVSLRSVNAFSD